MQNRSENQENEEMLQELTDYLSRQFFFEAPCPEYTTTSQKNVYFATASPDRPLAIIRQEDASDYLPCFDESDLLYGLTNAPIMMSYCPKEVIWLENKRYLTGPMIFFRVNEACCTVSLGLDDLPYLLQFLQEREILLETGEESFWAVCLD